MILHQLLRDTADKDLIGNAPEAYGRMVIILDDQLLKLADTVFVGIGILVKDRDKGNLRPDYEAQFITGIIEILGVLIMGQPDRIGSQLLDDRGIPAMLLFCQGIALIQQILVTAHAPQRRLNAIDDKALIRFTGERTHAHPCRHFIIGLIPALQKGCHRV